ncbi:MAG: hypothetical protein GC134_08730 [Proteobacteria bacterium]|nr:hypothetical protein [Pseudomonadota bacterium]
MTRLLTVAALITLFASALALTAEAQRVRYPSSTGDPLEDQQNQTITQLQQQIQQQTQVIQQLQTAANAMIQCGSQGKVYNGRSCQDAAGGATAAKPGAGAIPGTNPNTGLTPSGKLPF